MDPFASEKSDDKESGGVSLTWVHPQYLDDIWIDAGYYLNRAAKKSRGRYTVFDIRRDIESGDQHLWVLFRGDNEMILAMTTSFVFYPNRKNLCVAFIGSNDDSNWTKYTKMIVEQLEDFAREAHCDGIELSGRMGWLKVLSPYGWERAFVVLEKEIE